MRDRFPIQAGTHQQKLIATSQVRLKSYLVTLLSIMYGCTTQPRRVTLVHLNSDPSLAYLRESVKLDLTICSIYEINSDGW